MTLSTREPIQLMRLGPPDHERPAVRHRGALYDLLPLTADIDGSFLEADGIERVRAALARKELPMLDDPGDGSALRVGAPIARPTKVVCIGLNYKKHAEETNAPIPTEPVLFMKAADTVVGAYDDVLVPRGSTKTDWEVELAVVIGKTARYLQSHAEALSCVAGYAISNDVSEREFQLERGGQWDKGKSCETFNPLGPWLVPADDVGDVQQLDLKLWVNGQLRQNLSTSDMIFPVAEVVRYVSQFLVLRPGDVINTGTPPGVALGQPDPKPYLRKGDVMELEIQHLGRQRQSLGQA
ncbi:fumarylacetoacetate hydrolase family protein [Pendulispora albinea]|uniref:Fumarylacetoacetate hydrolase family protein n=1 Tax=Pendulispora albinea TaxID=2741071 RepID=A0ABZ2LQW9_9BACT